MSDFPPIADIRQREWHVRYVPEADIVPICANSVRYMQAARWRLGTESAWNMTSAST